MSKKTEKWYPLAIGIIIGLCCYLVLLGNSLPSSLKELFSAATTLSGIAIGFLGSAESILFSISETNVIKQLKNTNRYKILINYFMDAINWSFLLAVLSLIGLFIDFATFQPWHSIAFSFWALTLVTAGLSCYRVIDVFALILRS